MWPYAACLVAMGLSMQVNFVSAIWQGVKVALAN